MLLIEYYDNTISNILLTLMFLGFLVEPIPVEVTALTTAVFMIILGVLPTQEFLSILSNPAPWTIMAMFVLSGALVRTGLLNKMGEFISNNSKTRPTVVVVLLAIITILASAFINNTPVVVVLIPIVIKLASEMNTSASKFLIPLSYLSLIHI